MSSDGTYKTMMGVMACAMFSACAAPQPTSEAEPTYEESSAPAPPPDSSEYPIARQWMEEHPEEVLFTSLEGMMHVNGKLVRQLNMGDEAAQYFSDRVIVEVFGPLKRAQDAGATSCTVAISPQYPYSVLVAMIYTCAKAGMLPTRIATANAHESKKGALAVEMTHEATLRPTMLGEGEALPLFLSMVDDGYAIHIGGQAHFVPPLEGCPPDGATVCLDEEASYDRGRLFALLNELYATAPDAPWQFGIMAEPEHFAEEVVILAERAKARFGPATLAASNEDPYPRAPVYKGQPTDALLHNADKSNE